MYLQAASIGLMTLGQLRDQHGLKTTFIYAHKRNDQNWTNAEGGVEYELIYHTFPIPILLYSIFSIPPKPYSFACMMEEKSSKCIIMMQIA